MNTPDDQKFSAEDLKRAEKAIDGKTSGWNLARINEALNGVGKPLTLEEIRERVQTAQLQQLSRLTPDKTDAPVGEEWLPDGQQIDTTPEKVEASVDQIMKVLRIGLGLETETDTAQPAITAGITLPTDWSLSRNWTEIEIVDTTKLRRKAEMGILEESYGVKIEVLAQDNGNKVVTRYVLKNTGGQSPSQLELLETNLKLMSKPSSTRAIVSLEGKPQPTIRIMQGVPLPELLPEN